MVQEQLWSWWVQRPGKRQPSTAGRGKSVVGVFTAGDPSGPIICPAGM
jgi:hypothetical protein